MYKGVRKSRDLYKFECQQDFTRKDLEVGQERRIYFIYIYTYIYKYMYDLNTHIYSYVHVCI